jgi:magnesium chelatase family protein
LEISRYKNRLSEPFLDRIDLYVQMQEVSLSDEASYSSKELHVKVIEAFKVQKQRGQKELNGRLDDADIDLYCLMSEASELLLQKAVHNFALSFRSIKKVKKVARTIADLDGSKSIEKKHLLEALSFRRR